MEKKIITTSAQETRKIAGAVAQELTPGTTICLAGDLGTGKTTFAQGLLEALGAEGPFTSPTFVIMKEYSLKSPARGIKRIYHVDAYRVEEKDLRSLGFGEWGADPEGIVILEWPERVKGLIPSDAWRINFLWRSDSAREIIIQK